MLEATLGVFINNQEKKIIQFITSKDYYSAVSEVTFTAKVIRNVFRADVVASIYFLLERILIQPLFSLRKKTKEDIVPIRSTKELEEESKEQKVQILLNDFIHRLNEMILKGSYKEAVMEVSDINYKIIDILE